jgi:hypothetical protein
MNEKCHYVERSCENISDKIICESTGVAVDEETDEVIECYFGWDDKCHGMKETCDNYKKEECLSHTEAKCIPTDDGCKFAFVETFIL